MLLVRTNLLYSLFLFCDEWRMGSVCAQQAFRRLWREEGKETDMSAHLFRSGWVSMVPIKYIVLYEICSFSMVSDSRGKQWGGESLALILEMSSFYNWTFIYDPKNELPFPSEIPLWQILACQPSRRLCWPLDIYKILYWSSTWNARLSRRVMAFWTCTESG